MDSGVLDRQAQRHATEVQRKQIRRARLQALLTGPFLVGLLLALLELTQEDPRDLVVLGCVVLMAPLVSTFLNW